MVRSNGMDFMKLPAGLYRIVSLHPDSQNGTRDAPLDRTFFLSMQRKGGKVAIVATSEL